MTFLGKATISNDGATIISLLDVVHPAAKTLVDISKSQDAEVCRFVSMSNVTLWQGVRANVFSFLYDKKAFHVHANWQFFGGISKFVFRTMA